MRLRDYIVILLLLLVVGYGSWQGMAPSTIDQSQGQPVTHITGKPITEFTSASIESIRVGQRVVGQNPLREQVEAWKPDSETWRKVDLHMRNESGASLWITLIRPDWWVESQVANVGSHIYLELPEMGALGHAEVLEVGPCPEMSPGDSDPVVTGTFKHEVDKNSKVVKLRLEGQTEPTGVTDNHPYWSVDRQEFIPAGELRLGEAVNTVGGITRVASVEAYAYTGFVYNLETTEHVYRVGSLGSLVHNSCVPSVNPTPSSGLGNIGSHGPVDPTTALSSAESWLGKGYQEIAPGIFRSAGGLRQFRMTPRDLLPTHGNIGPHVHFEAFDGAGKVIENLHLPVLP
jgi:hypothetical protein